MNKYEIILSVCETHSISKTAEKLCYTQSAISQAIKGFEKDRRCGCAVSRYYLSGDRQSKTRQYAQ